MSALARKLQTADSVNTVWARICEQLLLLSAHATEAEGIVEDGYGIDRTDGGGREPQGGSDEQHTDEEIEALLDVRPSGAEGAGDWEGRPQSSRATGARLFPIPDASRSLAKGEAGEERKNAEEPQNGLAQPGSREERAPSKAELLQKKTADLQKRIAAIQAFKTPASEPPAEATALVGLAGYGSEMEDGEIAPSDDFPTSEGARPASRSGRSEEPSGEDDMDVDDIEGAPETGRSDLSAGSRQRQWRGAMGASPGKKATALSASRGDTKAAGVGGPEPLRSTLQQLLALGASPYEQMGYGVTGGAELDFAPPSRAAANPAATVSTPPSHLAYSYPTPPPMPYGGTEAAPEPPSYDPFAEAHPPPPPASPPPEDTWQAQPPPPSEEVSLLEPQPPPHVIEAAVVPTVEVQGPVLSAPPVRLARPPEAVPKAEQPKSVAEAAAAAAAAAGASRKGRQTPFQEDSCWWCLHAWNDRKESGRFSISQSLLLEGLPCRRWPACPYSPVVLAPLKGALHFDW